MQTPFAIRLAAAGAASIACVSAASAAHIDNFTEGPGEALVLLPGNSFDTDSFLDDGNAPGDAVAGNSIPLLGNERLTGIFFTPGPDDGAIISAQVDTLGGLLTFSNDPNTRGNLAVLYQGGTSDLVSNPSGPDYQALRIEVQALTDGPADFVVIAGDGTTTERVTFTASAAGPYDVLYDAFAGVDFSTLSGLGLEITGQNNGLDITLSEITRVVPEPASGLAILGLGTLALGRRRRHA